MDTYAALTADLIAEGYHEGAPVGFVVDAASIDQPIAERYPCSTCGGPMVYRPWIKPIAGDGWTAIDSWTGRVQLSYRAFAVCERCDLAQEF